MTRNRGKRHHRANNQATRFQDRIAVQRALATAKRGADAKARSGPVTTTIHPPTCGVFTYTGCTCGPLQDSDKQQPQGNSEPGIDISGTR